jgi:2-keto-3-deoxy-L-rhamnonate aldolase RhmA
MMKNNNNIKIGTWLTLAHPAIAEIMAKAGFDWIAVDLEHTVITIREAEELIRVINLCGVVPFVRLTSNDENLIKRVMDAGAHGVIVPMVKTAEEAQRAVDAVKYPPIGTRGVGLARAQGYGPDFDRYKEWVSQGSKVIVQIEHIDAVDHLREIFSVKGINGYIIGPYDLSGSMGKPGQFEDADVVATINKIKSIASEMEMPAGIHIVEPNLEELSLRIEEGYEYIAYSVDARMLDVSCRKGLSKAKGVIHERDCYHTS